MYQLTGSIVAYNNDRRILNDSIKSFLNTSMSTKLYIIDNSNSDALKDVSSDSRTEYLFNSRNLGFGKAHNIALEMAIQNAKYHLVLNPDVSFNAGTLEHLLEFMDKSPEVGLIIPKVLALDSTVQSACKRLPTPLDLVIRRLRWNLLNKIFRRRLYLYEMKDMDHDAPFEAPSISGCFMLFRTAALKKAGVFDDRFFMYMEDVDITRRVHKYFKTIYYPKCYILHAHARESYQFNKQFVIHTVSAIKYFNKWGWFFDSERDEFNHRITGK